MTTRIGGAMIAMLVGALGADAATNVAVTAKKLVVIDKTASSGSAKIKMTVADRTAGITNGVDASMPVSGRFSVAYAGGNPAGAFTMSNSLPLSGWIVHKSTVSKFVNRKAPLGLTEIKVAKIIPGKLIKVISKGIATFDIVSAGPPAGSVFTSMCVANGGTDTCHCSEYADCFYKAVAGGTGAKLVCVGGVGDPACTAAVPLSATCCTILPGSCGAEAEVEYGDAEVSCLSLAGTLGSPGSVCDASGTCAAAPGLPGPCCETSPSSCLAGPAAIPDQAACDGMGGAFFPSAVCGAGGKCF